MSAGFSRLDPHQDGYLVPSAALAVLLEAAPTTRNSTLRRVALAIWTTDVEGAGTVSLRALLQVGGLKGRCIKMH